MRHAPLTWADRKSELYARTVRRTSDERISAALARPLVRRLLLWQIFRTMECRLDARRARGLDAVLEFEIDGLERWQVHVAAGAARARRGGAAPADVRIALDGVAFVRLKSGETGWLELLLRRRLRIEGRKLLAVRFPGIFRIPRLEAEPRTDPLP